MIITAMIVMNILKSKNISAAFFFLRSVVPREQFQDIHY